ncbi:MAG TPA: DUF3426 domain-containing protein [Rhodocyclaceae bacterium]
MFTRCPTCSTTFRVTPEQLKARLGRVRCGQCKAVFNALDSLIEEGALPPPEAVAGTSPALPSSFSPTQESADNSPESLEVLDLTESFSREAESAVTRPIEESDNVESVVADEPVFPDELPTVVEEPGAPSVPETTMPETEEPVVEIAATESANTLLTHELTEIALEPHQVEAANEVLPPVEIKDEFVIDLEVADGAPSPVPAPVTLATTEADQEESADKAPAASVSAEDEKTVVIAVESDLPPAPTIEIEVVPTASYLAANDHTLSGLSEGAPVPLKVPPPAAPEDLSDVSPLTAIMQSIPKPDPLLHYAHHRNRSWPWVVGITLGLIALVLQLTLHYRVELAAQKPGLKPLLQSFCKPFGCTVPLPHKIDLLSIETSDLHPSPQKGLLQLSATLKNKAPFAQELPLLEVTLTDVADRTLIVKAIPPADYLPKEFKADAGFPARKEINVNLTLDAGDVPAAGYRVYLYHP